MLRLHGFPSSNYHNVVKLTLLEKAIEFEEVLVYTGAGDRYRPDFLTLSPQGKVPCLETEQGFLTESRSIVRYLEDVHPARPMYPDEPFARAKVCELTQVIDLYFELAARRVLRNFFTRSPPPAAIAREVRETLDRTEVTLARLSRFDEFLSGDRF
jgi:glutathione S-transferase